MIASHRVRLLVLAFNQPQHHADDNLPCCSRPNLFAVASGNTGVFQACWCSKPE